MTAGIVIAVAWWFILKVKGRKKIQASCKICGIAGAFVAFLSFSCLYITASVARYNVAGDVLLYLIFFYCMAPFAAELPESTFLKKKYAGMAVTAVFGVLLAGECVFTIDPVTRGLFLKLDTGNTTLCFRERSAISTAFITGITSFIIRSIRILTRHMIKACRCGLPPGYNGYLYPGQQRFIYLRQSSVLLFKLG